QTELNIAQAQEMALQGDPAVKLFGAVAPDYAIAKENIFVNAVDDQPINVFTESFNLGIGVKNFGKALPDSLKVTVVRELENGVTFAPDTSVYPSIFYHDTLYFEVLSAGV